MTSLSASALETRTCCYWDCSIVSSSFRYSVRLCVSVL